MAAELPPGLLKSDFDDIHAAVMETARGRWFLSEFARRTKVADTRSVLDAVARLENLMRTSVLPGTVASLAATPAGHFATTADQIAERLQDISWDLRERGFSDDVCAAVDRQATAVQGLARRLQGEAGAGDSVSQRPGLLPAPALGENPVLTRPAPTPAPTPAPIPQHCANASLARIDALPLAEKLAMFV